MFTAIVSLVGIVATACIELSGKATSGSTSLSCGDKKIAINSNGYHKPIGGN